MESRGQGQALGGSMSMIQRERNRMSPALPNPNPNPQLSQPLTQPPTCIKNNTNGIVRVWWQKDGVVYFDQILQPWFTSHERMFDLDLLHEVCAKEELPEREALPHWVTGEKSSEGKLIPRIKRSGSDDGSSQYSHVPYCMG